MTWFRISFCSPTECWRKLGKEVVNWLKSKVSRSVVRQSEETSVGSASRPQIPQWIPLFDFSGMSNMSFSQGFLSLNLLIILKDCLYCSEHRLVSSQNWIPLFIFALRMFVINVIIQWSQVISYQLSEVRVIESVFLWFLLLSRMGSRRETFTASGDEWTSGFKCSLCKIGKDRLMIRYQWASHNWWIVSCWCDRVWPFLETIISLLCEAITANALAICLVS